jgi:hypothetical protein
MEVWAENGDQMARQYGGSGAMHKVPCAERSLLNKYDTSTVVWHMKHRVINVRYRWTMLQLIRKEKESLF